VSKKLSVLVAGGLMPFIQEINGLGLPTPVLIAMIALAAVYVVVQGWNDHALIQKGVKRE